MKTITEFLHLYLVLLISTTTFTCGSKSNGLTMGLIHRDSPGSPLYTPHSLTFPERIRNLVRQTKMRRRYLFSDAKPESVRAKTNVQRGAIFLVEVGIGTFRNATPPYIPYFLVFDTGSDLTWTQCEDCRKPGNQCFNQTQPIFPNTRSASFRPLPCADPLRLCGPATQCRGGTCTFLQSYNDNSSARGVLGRESFAFGSTSSAAGRVESVRLVFGCGIDQRGIRFGTTQPNSIAGVMGSALGPLSLISQLRQQTDGRFSYCIPQTRNDGRVPRSLLRFGADVPQRRGTLRSTALLRLHGDVNPYYLSLQDMSIGGGRLRIPRNHFARNGTLRGSIIDSGSELSMIIDPAFEILKRSVVNYFSRRSGFGPVRSMLGFEVCLSRPASAGFRQLPKIGFLFGDGAELEVMPENSYVLGETAGFKYFCLAMVRSRDVTIIGAFQQRDQRVVYDTQAMRLYFGAQNCRLNA